MISKHIFMVCALLLLTSCERQHIVIDGGLDVYHVQLPEHRIYATGRTSTANGTVFVPVNGVLPTDFIFLSEYEIRDNGCFPAVSEINTRGFRIQETSMDCQETMNWEVIR